MIVLISFIIFICLFIKLFGFSFMLSFGTAKFLTSLIIGLFRFFTTIVAGVVLFVIPALIIFGIVKLCKKKSQKDEKNEQIND